jgi:hypothetical protein
LIISFEQLNVRRVRRHARPFPRPRRDQVFPTRPSPRRIGNRGG